VSESLNECSYVYVCMFDSLHYLHPGALAAVAFVAEHGAQELLERPTPQSMAADGKAAMDAFLSAAELPLQELV
jgi:hypothetical protein